MRQILLIVVVLVYFSSVAADAMGEEMKENKPLWTQVMTILADIDREVEDRREEIIDLWKEQYPNDSREAKLLRRIILSSLFMSIKVDTTTFRILYGKHAKEALLEYTLLQLEPEYLDASTKEREKMRGTYFAYLDEKYTKRHHHRHPKKVHHHHHREQKVVEV